MFCEGVAPLSAFTTNRVLDFYCNFRLISFTDSSILVANTLNESVVCININQRRIIAQTSVPFRPYSLGIVNERLYVGGSKKLIWMEKRKPFFIKETIMMEATTKPETETITIDKTIPTYSGMLTR